MTNKSETGAILNTETNAAAMYCIIYWSIKQWWNVSTTGQKMSLIIQDTEDIMVSFCADVIKEISLHVLATETPQFTYNYPTDVESVLLEYDTMSCVSLSQHFEGS